MKDNKFIAHVDMDAFFASIEQRDNPALKGRPVIVGADPKAGKGRGVVSTCSYEARRYGIHSAMPISIAYNKCPQGIFLPVNMEKYETVSDEIYDVFYEFTPDIEPISIDEAFLDITGSFHLFATPYKTCLMIKDKIKEKTMLTASIGLAPTKMAAKIASDLKKPDGLVEVKAEGLLEFLRPLSVRKIWGLGEKSEMTLNRMGIRTIGDLAGHDPARLVDAFGKNGFGLWQLANGIDERGVETEREAKSISNETTFDTDTGDDEKIKAALIFLAEKVSLRLRNEHLKAKTVTLKIRLEGFETYTRAVTLDTATNFVEVIYKNAQGLYNNFKKFNKKVRLVGVKASGFCPADARQSLFTDDGQEKIEGIHQAVDIIKRRFGEGAIHRATDNLLEGKNDA